MYDENTALDLVVAFIPPFEGCELTAYPDPASPLGKVRRLPEAQRPAGWANLSGVPWTIGYGSTHGVTPGMTITMDEAKYRLRIDLQIALNALKAKIGDVIQTLTSHQAAALIDFVYNLGTGNPKKPEWTIWKVLRAKRYDQVPGELAKFVNAGGAKLNGLVRRRAAEQVLWATDEPGTEEATPPSSVTRATSTPPTPVDPVPASKSAHVWTACGAALTACVGGVKAGSEQITAMISPYADQAPALHQVVNYCAMAAAGATVAVAAWAYVSKRWLRS